MAQHVKELYYEQARRFEIAAGILNYVSNAKLVPSPQLFDPGVPIVVNHAFALETYLKCLLQIEDKLGEGHELNVLFHGLDPGIRSRIEAAFKTSGKTVLVLIPTLTVAEVLDRCKDAFVEWRYLHEEKPINHAIYDAVQVLPSVRSVVWEQMPTLEKILPLMPWEEA
jgi:hypothetical protein